MPQNVGGSYDESLLRDAPVATKEQLQEGYNPGLLASSKDRAAAHRSLHSQSPVPPGVAPPIPPNVLTDIEQGHKLTNNGTNTYTPLDEKMIPASTVPFWRTTKGRIIIAVVAIVVIAAIIGGAVGGALHNKSTTGGGVTTQGQGVAGGNVTISTVNPLSGFPTVVSASTETQAAGSSTPTTSPGSSGRPPNEGGSAIIQMQGLQDASSSFGSRHLDQPFGEVVDILY